MVNRREILGAALGLTATFGAEAKSDPKSCQHAGVYTEQACGKQPPQDPDGGSVPEAREKRASRSRPNGVKPTAAHTKGDKKGPTPGNR